MKSEITIHHGRGSSLSGTEQRFSSLRVRLGRARDNDVVYDPLDDLLVSTYHAEIVREGDGLWIRDLGSRNGTYVNSERVKGRRRIAPEDEVRLGMRGPSLLVRTDEADHRIAATLPDAAMTGPSIEIGVTPRPSWKQRSRSILGDLSSMVRRDADKLRNAVGMPTLLRVVNATEKRGRVLVAVSVLATAALSLAATSGYLATREVAVHEMRVIEHVPSASIAEQVEPLEPSIYLVIARTKDRNGRWIESIGGTAWSVAPGLLATNAHVADVFGKCDADGDPIDLIARSNSIPPHDLMITGARLHPGYSSFLDLASRYCPFLVADRAFLDIPTPCDVALLEIDRESCSRQAPALELATDEELRGLRMATPVASIAFPAEGIAGSDASVSRPNANVLVGTLSKTSDVFFAKTEDFAEDIVLAYQLSVTGGASGSPVFGDRGRVIGLIAAGDIAGRLRNGLQTVRVPIGGTTYGPRVDMLRELLDGVAHDRQRERDPKWRHWFEAAFRRGVADVTPIIGALVLPNLRQLGEELLKEIESLTMTILEREVVTLRSDGESGAVTFKLPFPGRGAYALVAVAKEKPLRLAIRERHGKRAVFSKNDYVVCAMYTVDDPTIAEFDIYAEVEAQRLTSQVEVQLIVVR